VCLYTRRTRCAMTERQSSSRTKDSCTHRAATTVCIF
jgi:hypothetical protein